jgi:hypothetical protein
MTSRRPNVAMTSADLGDYRTVACTLFRFSNQAMAINESSSLMSTASEEREKQLTRSWNCNASTQRPVAVWLWCRCGC